MSTKYLNSGGPNSGLEFSYAVPTRITSFVITTANDVPDRDPASYQIFGFTGGSWQLLTSGALQLPAARFSDGAAVVLPELPMLSQYRVIFPTLKGSGQMMQIAELKLYGTPSSSPAAPLPDITLAVSPTSVAEDGPANLIYTFTRTGSTTEPLSVNYSVGGTASLGTDYTGIAGTPATITFAAGSAAATLTLDPTADSTVESDETVALTLTAGTGYAIGTPAAVVGTISNDDGTTTPPPPSPVALPQPTLITALDLDGFSSSPLWEQVSNAFDNTVGTKYLNSGGPNAGLEFSYAVPTRISSFVITTANDVPDRDPASYQIYGFTGGSWQLLTSGAVQLPASRLSDGASVVLPELPMLTQYRVIFPTLKGSGQMMQIAELKLYGVTDNVSPNNILTAGHGADTFRFDSAINGTATLDTLTNFNLNADRIELENAVFTALTFPGPLTGAAFGIGAVATNADQRILYNSLSGTLTYDEDGNGPWTALPFAQLSPGLAMNAGVFTVT